MYVRWLERYISYGYRGSNSSNRHGWNNVPKMCLKVVIEKVEGFYFPLETMRFSSRALATACVRLLTLSLP